MPGVSPARRSRSRWNGALRMTAKTYQTTTSPARIVEHRNDLVAGSVHAHLSPRRSGRRAGPRARGAAIARNSGVSRMCERALLRQRRFDHVGDPARPRRHHDDARRQIDRLGDRMGDEADRLVGARPQFQQLLVEVVAHDLVERAERLVHQQQVGVEGQRAGDRGALLHAARQLPGIFLLEARQVDEVERALDARLLVGRRDAHDLQRQRDVALDGAPRKQRRRLEDIAVGAPLAAPGWASCR